MEQLNASSADARGRYDLVAWLFLRALALIYLVAFASLGFQITALAGSEGIYPISESLAEARGLYGADAWWRLPTLFWIFDGDWALTGACLAGAVFSLYLLFSRRERFALIALFVLYLSLSAAGRVFLHFQWDYLLLEAGFLAIFLPGGNRIVVWLFRWLLIRLRLLSGLAKLASGDAGWREFTALNHYFETQPLPHAGAWFAHQLPEWLLRIGTGATLIVELVVPFFMFLPRTFRLWAAGLTVLWQLLIIATSNHNFFNLLTIALCLFLLDDQFVRRFVPARIATAAARDPTLTANPSRAGWALTSVLAVVLVVFSTALSIEVLRGSPYQNFPAPIATAWDAARALRIANRYHVFPTITTERIELEIEGSIDDGRSWQTYGFRYKPSDPARRPAFINPHQPRIDWQIWFTPLDARFLDWFDRFLSRLLEASPTVLAQLGHDPFDGRRPDMLRVSAWRYRFADPATRGETGLWWTREYLGPFRPLPFRER